MSDKPNIVICSLNSQYIHSSLAPWCLLGGIKKYCDDKISAGVFEGTINEPIEDVLLRIIENKPEIIGLSCYIWNITQVLELAKLIKENLPNAKIILGGPEVSYNAPHVLENNESADFIISGEGEKPFALLINAILYNNKAYDEIEGVCFRQGDRIVVNPPYVSNEEPPTPYSQDYFDALNGRIAYLETSRGCPYSCAFCLSGLCGNVRYFDIERAKNEILMLANSGTQTVKLVDRTFNANNKRAYELFDFIIKNYGKKIPHGVCFHFEIAGDILDDSIINLLATTPVGAIQLEIGLQSFNPKTLESINRKTDVEKLKNNIKKLLKSNNIHIHIDLITGLPFEDYVSFTESFNTAYALKPHMLQLGFLKLLYGSAMRKFPEKYPCEYSNLPPYEVIKTPWLNEDELIVLHAVEEVFDKVYNSGRFNRTLEYVLAQSGYTPFELFYNFSNFVKDSDMRNMSLDSFTEIVYNCFNGIKNVDQMRLRDLMVCDRLATNASGILPKVLQVKDANLKKVKLMLNESNETRQPKGVKRGIALLYSENCAVYADYQNKNPVTGEYELRKVNING